MGSIRVPEVVPSPAQDSERLRKAFEGWGADEKGIIWVLGHRNASQKRKIKDTYQELYNESLIDRLQSELSGDFKNVVVLWTYDPPERDAKLAREALKSKKKGVNQLQVIIEIACTTSPDHLIAVRQAYCSIFDCSLEEDIATSVSSPLNKILIGLVSSYRLDKEVVDSNRANSDASKLHGVIETKTLDKDDMIMILGTRNFFQLRATFECYNQTYGNSLDLDLQNAGNGDLQSVLRAVVRCIESPQKHFAEDSQKNSFFLSSDLDQCSETRGLGLIGLDYLGASILLETALRLAIEGFGTDESSLNRAIVCRAEIDMADIKREYLAINKSSLEDAVTGDTSGNYKDFLITLLGGRF